MKCSDEEPVWLSEGLTFCANVSDHFCAFDNARRNTIYTHDSNGIAFARRRDRSFVSLP